MDSLTQIVLGAAAGEVVLGKKIGNRALLFGAVGGTIPDLDVLGKFFLSNIDNLAFHRGISHSILFSIIGAVIFGWLVHRIYQSAYHKWIAIFCRAVAIVLVGFALDFVFKIIFPTTIVPTIIAGLGLAFLFYWTSKKSYFTNIWKTPEANLRDWQWLFFFSLITHPILDCFTMYGTQLFAPFSDMRVAWSTVSVVDPMYTVPFLLCLIVASRFARESKTRRNWTYAGIALSSFYLLFTVVNKQRINHVFETALQKQNIPVERFITNATIMNNILWNCTAETDEYFYMGQYSWFDEGEIEFIQVEKNHHLLNKTETDYTIQKLRWFSDDYFTVSPLEEKVQFNDLRFGTFTGKADNPNDFIFKFILTDNGEEGYYMEESVAGPPEGGGKEMMEKLINRIMGNK
ncbi:MAG: metal-dependent hydrolase [Chitinophagales bacterium]